jgi:tetratricopeptide (TPR) repeat protein
MPSSRLEMLQDMIGQDPRNMFARYGLAMEYKNSGDFEEAVKAFSALLEIEPTYSAAYFHGGQSLEKAGRVEEARDMYRRGVEATQSSGDDHARAEMQGALDLLG